MAFEICFVTDSDWENGEPQIEVLNHVHVVGSRFLLSNNYSAGICWNTDRKIISEEKSDNEASHSDCSDPEKYFYPTIHPTKFVFAVLIQASLTFVLYPFNMIKKQEEFWWNFYNSLNVRYFCCSHAHFSIYLINIVKSIFSTTNIICTAMFAKRDTCYILSEIQKYFQRYFGSNMQNKERTWNNLLHLCVKMCITFVYVFPFCTQLTACRCWAVCF